jgi:glycine reductase
MQAGANRVIQGVKIEHVCGDPTQTPELDRRLRRRLVERSLEVLQTPVNGPTLFHPVGGA